MRGLGSCGGAKGAPYHIYKMANLSAKEFNVLAICIYLGMRYIKPHHPEQISYSNNVRHYILADS